MSDSSDAQHMALKIVETTNDWLSRCADFGSAYCIAAGEYEDVLKKQKEKDKERAEKKAELVVAALSLCGGSILMSMFGKSALKGLTGNFVKNNSSSIAIKQGWDRAKTAIAWTDQSATAKFVMGELWDAAEKKVDSKLKSYLEALEQKAIVPQGGSDEQRYAQVFQNNLENLVREWANSVNRTARWAHDNLDGEESVEKLIETSPFFSLPKSQINVPMKAKRIELSFWMNDFLARDYVNITTWKKLSDHGAFAIDKHVQKPVVADAWSKSYPVNHRTVSNRTQTTQTVVYRQVGELVITHVNALYSEVFGGPFFLPGTDMYGNVTHETIRCAQTAIIQLADANAAEIKRSFLS